MSAIIRIEALIFKLDPVDILKLQKTISESIQKQSTEVALAKRSEAIKKSGCVHCGFETLVRWGKSKAGTQRFKCRNCKSTQSSTNETPFYRLRNRHLWSKYLGLMDRHIPLQALKDQYGFGLSLSTLHRWRQRFLSALIANPEAKLAGLIEADEKYFRTSFKGSRGWKKRAAPVGRRSRKRGGSDKRGLSNDQVPVLTALDRSGAICQSQLPNTRWKPMSEAAIPWIEPESMICSDGNLVYARIARQTRCEHYVVKKGHVGEAGLNIGRTDAYHRDVENLINRRCMGVSTHYLMNYFGWQRRIRQHKPFGNELLEEMLAG